jgi:hypothetical protein
MMAIYMTTQWKCRPGVESLVEEVFTEYQLVASTASETPGS